MIFRTKPAVASRGCPRPHSFGRARRAAFHLAGRATQPESCDQFHQMEHAPDAGASRHSPQFRGRNATRMADEIRRRSRLYARVERAMIPGARRRAACGTAGSPEGEYSRACMASSAACSVLCCSGLPFGLSLQRLPRQGMSRDNAHACRQSVWGAATPACPKAGRTGAR